MKCYCSINATGSLIMSLIFVNYRRTDTGWPANWLVDKLSTVFGPDLVAQDVRDIHEGDNFPEWIEDKLQKASVFLVLIGKDWLLAHDDVGRRRIDHPDDWVRKEIRYALANTACRVIPVFLDDYNFPARDNFLPEDMMGLLSRQAASIRQGKREADGDTLIAAIKSHWRGPDRSPDASPDALSVASVFKPPTFSDAMLRPVLFERIHTAIEENSVITIGGLSGSGKTYLMSSYVEEVFKKTGKPVYWYTPTAEESLEDLLAQFNPVFLLASGTATARCKQLLGHLSAQSAMLVIDDFHKLRHKGYELLIEVALGVKPPCHLVLLSQSRVEPKDVGNFPFHIDVEGLSAPEVQKLIEAKGVPAASRHAKEVAMKTGGLPFAVSLFCSLVRIYNYNPVELLSGTMNKNARVKKWFGDIADKLSADARFLLPRLALTDGPFSIGVVKSLMLNQGNTDRDNALEAFSELQKSYLVTAAFDYNWKVHDLAATLGQSLINAQEVAETHELLGKYFIRGIALKRSKPPLSNREFFDAVRAYRQLRHSPRTSKEAGEILSDLSRPVKLRGFYKLYAELLADAISGTKGQDGWLDYHYGHCLSILGEYKKALQFIEILMNKPAENRNRRVHVSLRRLHADLLASLGREDEAIGFLKSILADQGLVNPNDTVYQQVSAALAQLHIKKDELDTAEQLNNPLLTQALKKQDKRATAIALVRKGTISRKRGTYADAISTLETAFGLFKDEGDRRGMAWSLANLCEAQLLIGQEDNALPTFAKLQTLAKDIDERGPEYRDFILRAEKLITVQRLRNMLRTEKNRLQ